MAGATTVTRWRRELGSLGLRELEGLGVAALDGRGASRFCNPGGAGPTRGTLDIYARGRATVAGRGR